MMDATFTSVIRLFEQGISQKEICRRLDLSHNKVTQILVTAGMYDTEEARLYRQGFTVEQIAEKLQKSRKSVITRIPYTKGMYNAEYPSKNALSIRRCRNKGG